jgi:hypothetical protein
MTVHEFRVRFPRATETVIRANCSDYVSRCGPAPAPVVVKPKEPKSRKSRVPLVRNAGTWSEARYWQAVRSCLRRSFRFWRPAVLALNAARIASSGPRGRKWVYLCAKCGKTYLRKHVEIDHREACGALTSLDHIGEFLRRLTPEDASAYQVLCTTCHPKKTKAEAAKKRQSATE